YPCTDPTASRYRAVPHERPTARRKQERRKGHARTDQELGERGGPRLPARDGLVADKRIGPFFPAKSRGLAVTGHELHIVSQRKQLGADGAHELAQISVPMLPSADRAPEQDVPDKGVARALMVIGDMALGMARAVQNLDPLVPDLDLIAVIEPTLW